MPCTDDNSNGNATSGGYVLSDMPRYPPGDSPALSSSLHLWAWPQPQHHPAARPASCSPRAAEDAIRLQPRDAGLRAPASVQQRASGSSDQGCRLFWSHTTEECDMRWVKTKVREARKAGIMSVMKEKEIEGAKGGDKLAEVRDKKEE
jgi:hypothetical protein